MPGTVGQVEGGVVDRDGNFARATDRVTGIERKIGQDLVELGGVDLHRPGAGGRKPMDGDVFSDQVLEQLERVRQRFGQVRNSRRALLFAGKRQ